MKLPYKEGMTRDLRPNTALLQNPVAATTTLSVQRISFLSSRNQETVSIPVVLISMLDCYYSWYNGNRLQLSKQGNCTSFLVANELK